MLKIERAFSIKFYRQLRKKQVFLPSSLLGLNTHSSTHKPRDLSYDRTFFFLRKKFARSPSTVQRPHRNSGCTSSLSLFRKWRTGAGTIDLHLYLYQRQLSLRPVSNPTVIGCSKISLLLLSAGNVRLCIPTWGVFTENSFATNNESKVI